MIVYIQITYYLILKQNRRHINSINNSISRYSNICQLWNCRKQVNCCRYLQGAHSVKISLLQYTPKTVKLCKSEKVKILTHFITFLPWSLHPFPLAAWQILQIWGYLLLFICALFFSNIFPKNSVEMTTVISPVGLYNLYEYCKYNNYGLTSH